MPVLSLLPEHLLERTRIVGTRAPNERGTFVLYWMHTAVRGHENPALDVAVTLANARQVPLLVHHGLSDRYRYASDRHHTFILEGARDVSRELASRGIAYAFHLERAGSRMRIDDLASNAIAVVTEDLPVEPLRTWTARVAERWLVAAVDTACVVPMKLVGRAYDRAYAFERATRKLRKERVERPWTEIQPTHHGTPPLPYEPIDLATADLPELVASCAIDHAVGPVAHTRGGSIAGYARFQAFKEGPLRRYARDRNDPLRGASSRMSAYLHYGHVSPLRLAREATAAGAQKYLDELLTWREVAYAFCAYTDDVGTVDALPAWARATLAEHETDPRPFLPSWETLARGRTGDPLWDAAQAHLLTQGELHNNVRMTWGKALVGWTKNADDALALLVDLNHRYALDGRDPASYGGLLWCLGQFDRPFAPPRPVLGVVRPRPTELHAQRLDVAAYAAHTRRAPVRRRIAVVGAGLAGLVCARTLADHGHDVIVFDKGRLPGGRASSRPRDGHTFDHGAQYFTARSAWSKRHVASWEQDGVVARWTPRGKKDDEPWWVGTPTMGALALHLAKDLDVHCGRRVLRIDGGDLYDASGVVATVDDVVVAVPAPQARALVGDVGADSLEDALDPCWAVLLVLSGATTATDRETWAPSADLIRSDGAIAWAARESSKPGRPFAQDQDAWTLHLSVPWSSAHLEDQPDSVRDAAVRWFVEQHAPNARVVHAEAHRWRYARARKTARAGYTFDAARSLVVCGDWQASPRIEGALESGIAAAGCLLRRSATRLGSEPDV